MRPMQVIINDDETVTVDEGTFVDYYVESMKEKNDAALKCPSCKHVTVQTGLEITVQSAFSDDNKNYRLYCCANCGNLHKK